MQLCDAPSASPASIDGLIYAAREERLFPGECDLDLVGILDHLPRPIVIGMEIPTEKLSFTAGPEARARSPAKPRFDCSRTRATAELADIVPTRADPEPRGPGAQSWIRKLRSCSLRLGVDF
ncbi:MAG: hypothetical protein WD793_06980 [Steroidobacteraceae bacterium]